MDSGVRDSARDLGEGIEGEGRGGVVIDSGQCEVTMSDHVTAVCRSASSTTYDCTFVVQ